MHQYVYHDKGCLVNGSLVNKNNLHVLYLY